MPRLFVSCLSLLLLCGAPSAGVAEAAAEVAAENGEDTVLAPVLLGVADLPLPGDPTVAKLARDLISIRLRLEPSLAAESGLLADAVAVPSFAPQHVADTVVRLDTDLAALRALSHDPARWAALSVDQQVDVRWLFAQGELMRQRLVVERMWVHRPAEWLEPLGYSLVALAESAPQLMAPLEGLVPAMVDELAAQVQAPTARDVTTAIQLIDGIVGVMGASPAGPEAAAATAALLAYQSRLQILAELPQGSLPDAQVIGPEAYAWRFAHALLLPWTPAQLLSLAEEELARVDSELVTLEDPAPTPPTADPPTAEEQALAASFTRQTLLDGYDQAVQRNLAALREMQIASVPVVTVPDDLPALLARETPPAVIPLAGDGGSMNPPPLFGPAQAGHWNVQTYHSDWTPEQRLRTVQLPMAQDRNWFGYYAVHEGVPGHHLQLSVARSLHQPVRTLLTDTPSVEGWALYAEQLFYEGGVACSRASGRICGFGDTPVARANMLRSYRARVRRVVYDVRVETGEWTLQQAAEWRAGKPGVPVDGDVLRAINWPTQLIAYFAGKQQLLQLREDYQAQAQAQGRQPSSAELNDAILAQGQIPVALMRVGLLGEPVPPIP